MERSKVTDVRGSRQQRRRTDGCGPPRGSGLALALVGMVVVLGCAPKQRVPLFVGPGPVELFVDGRRLEAVPRELTLRSDRDHKIFVKRDGFRPELVVLETRRAEGAPRLEPGRVEVRLRSRTDGRREVVIEEVGEAAAEPRSQAR